MDNKKKYYSRRYLKEKYQSVKSDLEDYLEIFNDDLGDRIEPELVQNVKNSITYKLESILHELNK